MLSSPLKRFRGITQSHASSAPVWLLSFIAACGTGMLLVLFGWFWELLDVYTRSSVLPEFLTLGPRLQITTSWLEADKGILRGTTAFLAMLMFIVMGISLSLYLIFRFSARISLERALAQHRAVFDQLQKLSVPRSLAGMQIGLRSLIASDIPAIRDATTMWYRNGPRHLLQLVACCIVALLIDPLLSMLAIIGAVLARQLFSMVDRRQRRDRPVLLERRNFAAEKLADWCIQSPLMGTLSTDAITHRAFDSEAASLRKLELALDDHSIFKSPFSVATIALLTCMLMFVAATRILRADVAITSISVLILLLCIAIAAFSLTRFLKARQGIERVSRNIDHVVSLLTQQFNEIYSESKMKLATPFARIEMKKVCLRSYTDEPLLSDITATLHSGEVIAVVSNEPVSQNALAQLLLGFGRPVRGQLLFDGIDSIKLGAGQLSEASCWVAANGPLFAGTVIENLRTAHNASIDTADIQRILEKTGCESIVADLPNGLNTLISGDDDRLPHDAAFRLGIARALTLQRAVIVLEEPSSFGDSAIEDETRAAIETLAASGAIVVILPSRSKTLWSAHQVLFLRDGNLEAVGKHATLLEKNDAYRHWNYMKFSPHLQVPPRVYGQMIG